MVLQSDKSRGVHVYGDFSCPIRAEAAIRAREVVTLITKNTATPARKKARDDA